MTPERRRRLAALLLTAAAVAGNLVRLPLYPGVDLLLGSIAVLIAVACLGLRPALLAALAGGIAAWLSGYGPELLLFGPAEAAAVAAHRSWRQRRSMPPPPLAVSAALYWLLLGIPLAVLIHQTLPGLDWQTAGLPAVRLGVNGMLGAVLAGALLTADAILFRTRPSLSLVDALFTMLMMALLLPALLVVGWDHWDLPREVAKDMEAQLRPFGILALRELAAATADPTGSGTRIAAELATLEELLARTLDPAAAPRLTLARQDGAPPSAGAGYRLALPANGLGMGRQLIIEISRASLAQHARLHLTRALAALLTLALAGAFAAHWLSRRIAEPLQRLAVTGRMLPESWRRQRRLHAPSRGPFTETARLADAMTDLAASSSSDVRALLDEKDEQVRRRGLLDLQARTLSRLVVGDDDEIGFAEALCRQVRAVLPRHHCVLMLPDSHGRMRSVATPDLSRAERAGLQRLFAARAAERFVAEVMQSRTPARLPDHVIDGSDDLPVSLRQLLRGGWARPLLGRNENAIAVMIAAGDAARGGDPFAREVIDTAAMLAGIGLDAIQLRRRHEVLIEALSQAGTGIVIAARGRGDHLITYANRGFELLSGYRADEVLGRDMRFLQGPDRDQGGRHALRAALAAGEHCQTVLRNYRKDGTSYWVSLALWPMRDADGTISHYIGVQQDVTESVEATEHLHAEQERFRLVVNTIKDLLVRVDPEGRFEMASPSYCRTFGLSEQELIGRPFMPLVHPDDRAATAEAMARLFAPPYTCDVEQRAKTVHGWRWLQWSDTALRDEAGTVLGIVGVGRDITERKAAEQALRDSEVRFRALFETIDEGVIYHDADGVITNANPAAEQLMGVPRGALPWQPVADPRWGMLREDGTPLPPEECPGLMALRSGKDVRDVVLGIERGDGIRWLLVKAHPETVAGENRPHRVFITLTDITRLKETQQRLQAIIDSSPHGIVEVDPATRRLLWCNSAMLSLFGYRAGEIEGLTASDLHPPDLLPELIDDPDAAGDDPPVPTLSVPLYVPCRRRDGGLFYCKIAPGLMRLGNRETLTAFFTDVTMEYRGRRALEDSRQALLKAQAIAAVGSWEHDIENDRLTWSPEVYRILQQDPATFRPGIPAFRELVHPDDRTTLMEAYRAARTGQRAYDVVHRVLLPGGGIKWVHERAGFDRAADGHALVAHGTVQDITERRLAELNLAEREAMLSELLALAATLVRLGDDDLDAASERALARIGAFIGVDRCGLFRRDDDWGNLCLVLEWTGHGVPSAAAGDRDFALSDLPALAPRLAAAEPIAVASIAALPAAWSRERALFAARGVQSVLMAPLAADDGVLGFVVFEAVRAPRVWSDVEIHFLQVFANILASARERARAAAALRISNTRYDELARQGRTMAWEVDAEGRYAYVNSASLVVFGEPPEALLGRRWSTLIAPGVGTGFVRRAQRIIERHGDLTDFLNPRRHRDGHTVWVLTSGAPILDGAGRLGGYRGTDKDVTEQYLAQQELRRSQERLSTLFDNAPIGMALVDHRRRLLLVNRALAAFVGRSSDELVGQSLDRLAHPDDLGDARARFAELLAGERRGYRMTKRYLRPDGSVLWGDVRVALLPAEPEAPPAPLLMVEDITELHEATERQKMLEDTLADYTTRLEDLLDLINRSLPPEEQVQALLRLGCKALGGAAATLERLDTAHRREALVTCEDGPPPPPLPPCERLLKRPGLPAVLSDAPRATATGFDCCIALAFTSGELDGGSETLVLALWGKLQNCRLTDPARQLLRLIAQRIAAVRYQQRVQQELVQAKERETIGHLASGVAHDFNNLLGIIDANLFYVDATLESCDVRDTGLLQVLEETRSALGQAKVVTSGMLSLSRAGGMPVETVNLAGSIGELESILRQILPPAIRLEVRVPAGLTASSNGAFLQSALLNLALNARDAMPDGGRLSIVANLLHERPAPLAVGVTPPGAAIEINVTDTGTGIAADAVGRIFDPLFSTKARRRGHGLGLFMVKEFVIRSGAGLAVASTPGQGSCFKLLLPVDVLPIATDAGRAGAPDSDGEDREAPLAGRRVLVVDDDPRVRDAVARLLTLEGIEPVLADSARACLERLGADPDFDLVLTDIAMPMMDGLELLKRLGETHPRLPVLLMTGHGNVLKPGAAAAIGTTVLRKPLDPPRLRAALVERLGDDPLL